MTGQQTQKRAKKSRENVKKAAPAPPPGPTPGAPAAAPAKTPAAPPKNGRPTKLTLELQGKIVEKIKRGVYPEIAAVSCGINRATFYRWQQAGENARAKNYESSYRDFCDAVDEARACAEAVASSKLYEIATEGNDDRGSPGALIEYLRRTAPERWAVKDQAKTGTDEDAGELTVNVRFVGGEADRKT